MTNAAKPQKIASPENEAVAMSGYHPARDSDPIDWRCKLFDDEGYEHRLISLGGAQVVTKVSFAYAIWDRSTGKCTSHSEGRISNTPMSDQERQKRRNEALEILRGWHNAVPEVVHPAMKIIEKTCRDFDGAGIYSVGAKGALEAMAHHWKDHLAQGHSPQIIADDIDEMKKRLDLMCEEIMSRVDELPLPTQEVAPAVPRG